MDWMVQFADSARPSVTLNWRLSSIWYTLGHFDGWRTSSLLCQNEGNPAMRWTKNGDSSSQGCATYTWEKSFGSRTASWNEKTLINSNQHCFKSENNFPGWANHRFRSGNTKAALEHSVRLQKRWKQSHGSNNSLNGGSRHFVQPYGYRKQRGALLHRQPKSPEDSLRWGLQPLLKLP